MRCPTCGATPTTLVASHESRHLSVRHVRECVSGHRFESVEVMPAAIDVRALKSSQAAQEARWARWKRNERIAKAQGTTEDIARREGLSRSRVLQVKQDMAGKARKTRPSRARVEAVTPVPGPARTHLAGLAPWERAA